MKEPKILIIEDDKILNGFFKEFFQIYFNNIIQAYDGLEALDLYKEHNPDLVITDLNLPKLDGLSVIQEMSKLNEKTQFVIMTGDTEQTQLEKALELNLIAYLVKPVESTKLQEVIKNIKSIY